MSFALHLRARFAFRVMASALSLVAMASSIAQAPQMPMSGPQKPSQPIPLPAPNPQSPPQLTSPDVTAFLDGFMPLQLERDDVAGATVAIYRNGQPLLLKGYGYADYAKKTPVDPVTTTFRPGSISKLFTYVSMMQLVEQGKLSLDANVQQYLDFNIEPGPSPIGSAPITLRNLATHTAGFEEELHDFGSDKSGKLPLDLRTFLVRNQPHRFAAPGKALAYSNYGIALLGYVVQRVSGEPFAAYVQHHIFTPLGMKHSTFEQPLPAGLTATLGYLKTAKPDTGFEGVTESPAGGLSSTAADMAIFGQMLLGHGTYNGAKVLDPASVETLFTPQFKPAAGVSPWDLGFYDEDRNGLRFIGHGGDLLACHSQFWVEPTHGLLFFISYNSAGSAEKAREELFRAFVDRYLPGSPAPHPAYVKLSEKDLAAYAGTYLTSRRADSTKLRLLQALSPKEVSATKDGELTVSTAKDFRGVPLHFHPVGNDTFYEETSQNSVHFERDASGKVTGYATPSHADRAPFGETPLVFGFGMSVTIGVILLVCLAPVVRVSKRIFLRKRPRPQPAPGTIWLTRTIQFAAFACVAVLLQGFVLLTSTANADNFYAIGHFDRWFAVQNVLSAIALFFLVFGVISAVLVQRKPLRWITKVKFGLVGISLVYFGWFLVYFHLLGSATRY